MPPENLANRELREIREALARRDHKVRKGTQDRRVSSDYQERPDQLGHLDRSDRPVRRESLARKELLDRRDQRVTLVPWALLERRVHKA